MRLRGLLLCVLLLGSTSACSDPATPSRPGPRDGGPVSDAGRDGSADVDAEGLPDANLPDASPDSGGVPPGADADGDGILNSVEGAADNVDTDGDGTPDYLDSDSDGDGLLDSLESGAAAGAAPVDTDHDGTPDFRDLDSDGNGIPDSIEGAADPDGDGQPSFRDLDNDGDAISDIVEIGASPDAPLDSDGDGTPDYLDLDSDADGIPDSVEAGVGPTPLDSDGDGVYDFRDPDSDGNGVPDSLEGVVDSDGDGQPDYRDLDNDGDFVGDAIEVGPDPAAPLDSDRDGTPDYLDLDSDGDTIRDLEEAFLPDDTDSDGTPDRLDLDSDNDGLSDSFEAGDANLFTPARDTDLDGVPDYRDPDSDNDGLSDAAEVAYGTNPYLADTDGDGVTDLIEISACPVGDATCAADAITPTSSPRTRGDFVFLEPFLAPPEPLRDTLSFATDLRMADVYFLMDTTGSMGGAIASLKSGLSTPGTGLIDRVRAVIPDVWFGVGGFDDYQQAPYGYATSGDRAYYHLQDLTGDIPTAQAAVNRLATHYGGDGPEASYPSLYAVASGNGLAGPSGWPSSRASAPAPFAACPASASVGWPCFRNSAVPIVVSITDIGSHNGPVGEDTYAFTGGGAGPSYSEVVAAANASRIRAIGIAVSGGGRAHLTSMAVATGAVDAAGAALVSDWSVGSPIGDEVVRMIQTLADQTPLDISVVFRDDPADTVDTFAAFVDHIEANTVGVPGRCDAVPAVDTNGDGYRDTFQGVRPGTPVCFDIIVKQNDTVPPTAMPQMFRANLQVLGDGFTPLDTRDIFFLVPPLIQVAGGG